MTPTTTGHAPTPADVLVVFGITGDLARVMTFRSLYRLEKRELLDLPGGRGGGRRLDARPAGGAGAGLDRGDGGAARRGRVRAVRGAPVVRARGLQRPGHLPAGRRRDRRRAPGGVLPGDPALPVRAGRPGAPRGRPDDRRDRPGREAVRARPAVGHGAGRRAAPVHRRVAAVPHRPLPREDGPRGDPAPAVRQRDPRAAVEPQLRRVRADHHGRELRHRRPRPLLRPRGRAARRRPSTT